MKRYGLLGEHLSHSYSKIIHSSIFKSLNLEASYSLLECKEEELKNYIDQLRVHWFNILFALLNQSSHLVLQAFESSAISGF